MAPGEAALASPEGQLTLPLAGMDALFRQAQHPSLSIGTELGPWIGAQKGPF